MKKLIEVQNLKKSFRIEKNVYRALFDVNFDIYENEIVGLVGESGCGKSLIAKLLLHLEKKDEGKIFYRGTDLDTLTPLEMKKMRRKMQIIFQDPYASLNPKMTIQNIIGEPLDIHSLYKGKEKERRIEELLEQVGLNPDNKNRYPYEFSGGQRQRIGIARALAVEPEFIICDEPISALDVSIQAQIINLLKRLKPEKGLSYLFIAHDLSMVKYISDRILVMYLGHIVESGTSDEIYKNPLHPYTQALFSSIAYPDPDIEKKRVKIVLNGEVPSILNPPKGCPFHPRCPKATNICREKVPIKKEISPNHFVNCHLFADN